MQDRLRSRAQPARVDDLKDAPSNPKVSYNMGKNEKTPVNILAYLQKNHGDPAVKVSAFTTITQIQCVTE